MSRCNQNRYGQWPRKPRLGLRILHLALSRRTPLHRRVQRHDRLDLCGRIGRAVLEVQVRESAQNRGGYGEAGEEG